MSLEEISKEIPKILGMLKEIPKILGILETIPKILETMLWVIQSHYKNEYYFRIMYSPKEQHFLITSHCIAFVIHLVSSILSFMEADKLPTLNGNITLANYKYSKTPPHTVVAYNTIGDTQQPVRWVAWNETLTWVAHLVAIIIFVTNHESARVCESARRWFSYAITAGLLQVAMILSLGPVPLFLIIFLMVNNAIVQTLGGFMVDQEEDISKRVAYLSVAMVLFLASATFVAVSCLQIEGIDFSKLSVSYSGLAVIYGVFYASFGIVQLVRQCYKNRDFLGGRVQADGVFVLLSITSKVVLSWCLISIVHTGLENLDIVETSVNWQYVQLGVIIAAALVVLLGLVINLYYFKEDVVNKDDLKATAGSTDNKIQF